MLFWDLVCEIGKYCRQRWLLWRKGSLGVSRLVLNFFLTVLGWFFLPLENERFRRIREQKSYYYPHIDFDRLRPLDIVHLAIQTVFLI